MILIFGWHAWCYLFLCSNEHLQILRSIYFFEHTFPHGSYQIFWDIWPVFIINENPWNCIQIFYFVIDWNWFIDPVNDHRIRTAVIDLSSSCFSRTYLLLHPKTSSIFFLNEFSKFFFLNKNQLFSTWNSFKGLWHQNLQITINYRRCSSE